MHLLASVATGQSSEAHEFMPGDEEKKGRGKKHQEMKQENNVGLTWDWKVITRC
jgi:hypothetical protein